MTTKLTTVSKVLLAVLVVGLFVGGKYLYQAYAPQTVKEATLVEVEDLPPLELDKNFAKAALAPLPSTTPSEKIAEDNELRFLEMGWNAQSGINLANGGPVTTEGSFMDQEGIRLRIINQNDCMVMGSEAIAFIKEYAAGHKKSRKGAHAFALMGDGVPAMIAGWNDEIKKSVGEEYILQVFYAGGRSYGEDAVYGPKDAKRDPSLLKGSLFVGVLRDGDWNILMQYADDNGLIVNNNEKTFDRDAINVMHAPSYTEAANIYIANQGEKRPLVSKGKTLGRDTTIAPTGFFTWSPADRTAALGRGEFVVLASTKDYGAQMANTWIASKKWLADNSKTVESFILAASKGGDQVKSHGSALKRASEINAEIFAVDGMVGTDWEKLYKGYVEKDANGVKIELGGSAVFNLADNAEYFGLNGSSNKYAAVYKTFGDIVVTAFPEVVPSYPAYDEVVNLSYLRKVYTKYKDNVQVAGAATVQTFEENSTVNEVFANKTTTIEFKTGSAIISEKSEKELQKLLNSFTIANGLLVQIDGYTDNTGDPLKNEELSRDRAASVRTWFIEHDATLKNRIKSDGHGQDNPIAPNETAVGRQKNRRVEITLGRN